MNLEEAIERLNSLAAEAVKNDRPLRTTEELKAFFKNPPKRPRSIPMEEASLQKKMPFGFRTRHDAASIALKCSLSRAKCSTALLITTSAKRSGYDIVSSGSYRKRSAGSVAMACGSASTP